MLTIEQFQRFMTKVLVPTNPNGCWEWTAHKDKDGYGFFWLNQKNKKAHRIAYAHFHGEDPGDLFVCHTCDNPKCVNPAHLWKGTRTDNAQDMVSKGRAPTHIGDIVRNNSHCKNGHLRTSENTIETTGRRRCRECNIIYHRQWRKNSERT